MKLRPHGGSMDSTGPSPRLHPGRRFVHTQKELEKGPREIRTESVQKYSVAGGVSVK